MVTSDGARAVVAQIDPQEADWDPISRPDHEILRENLAQLRAASDVDGRPFHVITLPVPALRHYLPRYDTTCGRVH
jgi:hypothetical protein